MIQPFKPLIRFKVRELVGRFGLTWIAKLISVTLAFTASGLASTAWWRIFPLCSDTLWPPTTVNAELFICCIIPIVHSLIHSRHFYSASSSPLLLRGAPDYSTDTASEFHAESHRQL